MLAPLLTRALALCLLLAGLLVTLGHVGLWNLGFDLDSSQVGEVDFDEDGHDDDVVLLDAPLAMPDFEGAVRVGTSSLGDVVAPLQRPLLRPPIDC
jgi:hypothetical protein